MTTANLQPIERKCNLVTQSTAVLIPAWQPDTQLLSLVPELIRHGFRIVIVVDDGSGPEYQGIFEAIAGYPEVRLLRHAVNMGKGRALKTGMNYFLNDLPEFGCIVTADADGQHTPEDILLAAQAWERSPGRMVLGVRQFSGSVPLRSRLGNSITRQVFRFLTGRKLADTQSGLRAIPRALVPELLVLPGERYEYEMTMLAHVCRSGRFPVEVPIRTVYLEGNRSSHFDPIRDSMRIYFVLVRFYFSSLIAAGIDMAGFSLMFSLTGNVFGSVLFGRLSSLVNFALNKRFVFHSHGTVGSALWRYYLLVAILALLSYESIHVLADTLRWNVFAAKILVESLLSLASFSIQRQFVFRHPPDE